MSTRVMAIKHDVSLATIRRHLQAAGIRCRKPARRIPTDLHRQNRLKFAREFITLIGATMLLFLVSRNVLNQTRMDENFYGEK